MPDAAGEAVIHPAAPSAAGASPAQALKSTSTELQLLGLRTLEFWVDSLNPDFLDPCIAEVEPQLMLALWALLKPQQIGRSLRR